MFLKEAFTAYWNSFFLQVRIEIFYCLPLLLCFIIVFVEVRGLHDYARIVLSLKKERERDVTPFWNIYKDPSRLKRIGEQSLLICRTYMYRGCYVEYRLLCVTKGFCL